MQSVSSSSSSGESSSSDSESSGDEDGAQQGDDQEGRTYGNSFAMNLEVGGGEREREEGCISN